MLSAARQTPNFTRRADIKHAEKSRAGWITRHGLRRVPRKAVPFVAAGLLTPAAARVGVVWDAIAKVPGGAAPMTAIARNIGLHSRTLEHTIELLIKHQHIRRELRGRAWIYIVKGERPKWQHFASALFSEGEE